MRTEADHNALYWDTAQKFVGVVVAAVLSLTAKQVALELRQLTEHFNVLADIAHANAWDIFEAPAANGAALSRIDMDDARSICRRRGKRAFKHALRQDLHAQELVVD